MSWRLKKGYYRLVFLKHLKLVNYRNYLNLEHQFNSSITVLVGNNAQGKSNLLEAIYFLATTKSLKATEDEELIATDQNFSHVFGQGEGVSKEEFNLEISMQKQEKGLAKRMRVNGLPRRVIDYIGQLYVVSFAPEDLNLVTASPSLRRWHIDLVLAQIDREYKRSLTQYGDVVTRKNRILKRIREHEGQADELDYWLDQQILLGNLISETRQKFFDYLNSRERTFPIDGETLEYRYMENPVTKERLLAYRDKEIWTASSLVGPHRDDFQFISHNSMNQTRDLNMYGSRGEQRTAVLDLKVSEVSYIEHLTGQRPVLLLDDVFSELDQTHRQHVMNLIHQQQTIMTVVELEELADGDLKDVSLYRVENGTLVSITGT